MFENYSMFLNKVDNNFNDPLLIEALEMYHSLIKRNIIKPRENQLNTSGTIPQIIHFNSSN